MPTEPVTIPAVFELAFREDPARKTSAFDLRTARGMLLRTCAVAFAALAALAACGGGQAVDDSGNGAIYTAWRAQQSHVEVTATGSVARVLGVSRGGRYGPHEGFIVHLSGSSGRGLSLKVEDNLDLTGRIPIESGDSVVVRGEYIYDARGGILHWTHHDPAGRHPAGFVKVNGRIYE